MYLKVLTAPGCPVEAATSPPLKGHAGCSSVCTILFIKSACNVLLKYFIYVLLSSYFSSKWYFDYIYNFNTHLLFQTFLHLFKIFLITSFSILILSISWLIKLSKNLKRHTVLLLSYFSIKYCYNIHTGITTTLKTNFSLLSSAI